MDAAVDPELMEVSIDISGLVDAELTVRTEIKYANETGFEDSEVRTISENACALKFDQSGLEES